MEVGCRDVVDNMPQGMVHQVEAVAHPHSALHSIFAVDSLSEHRRIRQVNHLYEGDPLDA